ncbi:MAG: hypothetical protein GC162_10330 [Planctomycetes bacterium]|nr:hypothetical protein [Planctomycetota bacterium]
MNDTKPFYTSHTFWAAVGVAAVAIARYFGYSLSESDSMEASGHVEAIVLGLLSLWTIIGRVKASKKITLK